MRVVFMGTPALAAVVLEGLMEAHEVVGVYTRPDAVRGRGKTLVPSPVKMVAEAASIPVFSPKSFKDPGAIDGLRALKPDVLCVAAYGLLLPKEVLNAAPFGALNVHGSLLPRWRGAAPMERAILAGDERAGVCIMAMEEGLDSGPYALCESFPLGTMTLKDLTETIAQVGTRLLLQVLAMLDSQKISWTYQDESLAVYAPKIEKGELNINPEDSVDGALRKIRASSEGHPSKAVVASKPLTILSAAPADGSLLPGSVSVERKGVLLGMKDGTITLESVKPDGKKAMDGKAFAAGLKGQGDGLKKWESYERRS